MNFEGGLERFSITKEVVLETIIAEGNSEKSRELLGQWIDQRSEEIRNSFPEGVEQIHAELDFQIEKLQLFVDGGLFEEAFEEIDGGSLEESPFTDEQYEKLKELYQTIKVKLNA